MAPLNPDLRGLLERAVVMARDEAERAAQTALAALGVAADRATEHLSDEQRRLRVALRAKQRQLGDIDQLISDVAYEHWHRMLFARFLAENSLLIHPEHDIQVTLAECEEIARESSHGDGWLVAADFAARMLPGIFRRDDPVLQLRLPPEGQQALERILATLPSQVFTSDDALGWVYQYWQAKRKNEVNRSERKIGGADIAPVTQLFTEHYMVRFLLENSLGAWWAARHPESPLIASFEYLRFNDNGIPAAGEFPGWPHDVANVTVMDPCCGSGHFLVTAFDMLREMRMQAESVSAAEAGDAVLRDNLFGLELDARCTQIAAFALALAAWKDGGYRDLPLPNLACSGIAAAGRLEDWKRLAKGDKRLETSLTRLHAIFSDATDVGSLIDPLRETDGELLAAEFGEVAPLLEEALGRETEHDPTAKVFGAAAAGAARAGSMLGRQYTLVVTNPPFLGLRKQGPALRRFIETRYSQAKADLATCFIERCTSLANGGGSVSIVTPQNWLFLSSYRNLRSWAYGETEWNAVALLGSGAFEAITGAVVNVCLFGLTNNSPSDACQFMGIDAGVYNSVSEKKRALIVGELSVLVQREQRLSPDGRLTFDRPGDVPLLEAWADSLAGIMNGDSPRFQRMFWEFPRRPSEWVFQQSTVPATMHYGGRERLIYFDDERGHLRESGRFRREVLHDSDQRGNAAWGRTGVAVSQMSNLSVTLYTGEKFDSNVAVIVPHSEADTPALWSFCSDAQFPSLVRKLDRKMNVTNATIAKIPFDRDYWASVAAREYPHGLPQPSSLDPTQWVFDGQPRGSMTPLQVAVARLVGYRWPRQTGSEFRECPVRGPDDLDELADRDGVVCLPGVRGEGPAVERLRNLLAVAFADDWSPANEADLLAAVGFSGKQLDLWLRDGFFEQHCQLFHQRPFVWHVWDGRRDGFAALINYHRLDRAMLEKLVYGYLGEWIQRQRAEAQAGEAGSEDRLVAALELQRKLALILEGEAPYDIFVRWKPIEDQSLGWDPDLDDGVRLNIRPFVMAGALRKTPKINWNKDRGKDREDAPWYHLFGGDRINDHHQTIAEKRAARGVAAKGLEASV